MGHAAAESVVDAGLELVPVTFTANPAAGTIAVRDVEVELKGLDGMAEAMEEIKARYPDLMVIDYTLPQAVNPNAELYTSLGLPFVMGTTGGDREGLMATVDAAGTYAVISPNMGKQIVALQSMLEYAEDTFPGAWAGYKLEVVESHQSTKVDTSGTAKALVKSFQGLGMGDFAEEDIEKVRDREGQLGRMNVPEEHINGHAYHTYTLTSPDGTVQFQFQHNVCGRRFYAEGTVDALLFLKSRVEAGADQKVYSMRDVLEAGAMR